MNTFTLPDLGEGLAESEIVQWHVQVGDTVKLDQIVLTVETAKAVVDVPAPYAGTIAARHGEPGDVLQIGDWLLEIEESDTAIEGAGTLHKPNSNNDRHSLRHQESQDAATVVGSVSQITQQVEVDDFWVGGVSQIAPHHKITAMPSARALAQKLGIDIDQVKGTGSHGLIVDQDVYDQAGKQKPGTQVLKGARRSMAIAMTESHQQVAAVTLTEEAVLNHFNQESDISIMLLQGIVAACQAEPALNAWFDASTMTRCVHQSVNIGVAVDSAHGLYVPVLRNADQYSSTDMRQWLSETAQGIRERKIAREQLQHATITLSNFGAIAGLFATPVVSPPQVAIIGAGRLSDKLVLQDGQVIAVKTLPLSITFDHRACTGGEAARFTKALVSSLESNPP